MPGALVHSADPRLLTSVPSSQPNIDRKLLIDTMLMQALSRSTLQGPLQNLGCLSLLRRTFASEPAYEKALPELPPFGYQPQPYTGPSKEEVLALRKKFLSPCESRFWLCCQGEFTCTVAVLTEPCTPCRPVPPLQRACDDHRGQDAVHV